MSTRKREKPVLSNEAIQCRMARVALDLSVKELSALAQVSTNTISRLERGEDLKPRTIDAIKAALEKKGVEFIPENGAGPGVRISRARDLN